MQSSYSEVFRQPGVRRTVVPYLVGRFPSGMALLALLMFVQERTGSFAMAGTVTACFAVGVALTAPLLGRLIDARGQARVLVTTALLHPAAMGAVLVLSTADAHPGLVGAAAMAAGASVPPLSACMRSLWPQLLPHERLRATGYAVEAVIVEACELAGPLLVAVLVASSDAGTAVLVSALLSGGGALAFASAPASRSWRGAPRRTGRWTGPLTLPGVRWLLLVVVLSTAGFSVLEIAVAGFAVEHGSQAATGYLLAAWFAGSLLGGSWYGARAWRTPPHRQLVVLLLLVAVGGLLTLAATGLVTMALLLVVAGIAVAPATAVQLAIMAHVAPERCRTEAFTWAGTSNFLGIGLGSVMAGTAVNGWGVSAALLLAAVPAGLAVVAAHAGRRSLAGAVGVARRPRPPLLVSWEEHLEVLRDVDRANDEVRSASARNVELAREVARLRQRLREVGAPPQRRPDEVSVRLADGLSQAEADLAALEARRQEVLSEVQRLRARLDAERTGGVVEPLPLPVRDQGGTVTPLRALSG